MATSPVPDEIWEFARAIYPERGPKGARELMLKLGHDVRANTIVKHMQERGIAMTSEARGEWSEEDNALLQKEGPKHSARYLQQRFFPSRTGQAVERQAQRLGVAINRANREQGGRTEPMVKVGPWDDECHVVFLGDQQCPEHDLEAHRVVTGFLTHFIKNHKGSKLVVLMGDGMNLTRLGRFDYDPDTESVEQEIHDYRRLIEDYAEASGPDTQFVVIEGNHEYRLWKTIQREPNLKTLIAPWWELLELDRILGKGNWSWVPYMAGYVEFPGPFLAHHGYRVSAHSAYAAKLHVENTGVSMIAGHTHRIGAYYKTYYDRTIRGYENGSLCVPQSYGVGTLNWQSGFSFGRWHGDRYTISQVEIIDGKANIEGRWYGLPVTVEA